MKMRKIVFRRSMGFSLVELLVVIAVIFLLARILMPSLGRARQRALAAVCVSNLRQLGVAFRTYTHDFGYYPGTGCVNSTMGAMDWVLAQGNPLGGDQPWSCSPKGTIIGGVNYSSVIGTYANPSNRPCKMSVFWCPVDRLTTKNGAPWIISYGMTGGLQLPPNTCSYSLLPASAVKHPSSTMLLDEEACGESLYGSKAPDSACNDAVSFFSTVPSTASSRHFGGSHVLFCDTHVVWAKKPEIDADIASGRGFFYDGRSGQSLIY